MTLVKVEISIIHILYVLHRSEYTIYIWKMEVKDMCVGIVVRGESVYVCVCVLVHIRFT